MGQLVLLVVAAAWAAVLVPPLLRSRIENRPNSSVTDFRNQLSSLQRAMPSRGVAMRSMSRPLGPVTAQPAGGPRPSADALRRSHPRWEQSGPQHRPAARPPASACTTPRHGPAATAGDTASRPGPQPAPTLGRSAPAMRSSGAEPTCCSSSSSSRPARCSSPPRPRPRRCSTCSASRSPHCAATSTCSARSASARQPPAEIVVPAVEPHPPHRQRHTEVRRSAAHRRPCAGRRRTAGRTPSEARALPSMPAAAAPVHSRRPRGCSSVGRAQQSHC